MHIYEEFVIRSHIQAYKGDANIYGPLWTLTCICAVWTFFFFFSYYFLSFLSLFLHKRLYHPLHHRQLHERLSPSSQHHILLHPLIYSPVVYKDNFPLFYMYKSSRYYFVFDIDLGHMFPRSTSL